MYHEICGCCKKAQEIVSKRGADNKSGNLPLYACETWLKENGLIQRINPYLEADVTTVLG